MKTKTENTHKAERKQMDLSDRLLLFTSQMLYLAGSLPEDRAGNQLAESILRHSTAAYFRHGEAEGSPSAKEFTQKLREALSELRILRRALLLLDKVSIPCDRGAVRQGLEDADILVRIFFSSVRTLENKASQ
jgi:hypothetical protein